MPLSARQLVVLLIAAYLTVRCTLWRLADFVSRHLPVYSFKSSRKLPQLTSRGQRPAPPRHLAILLADSDAASQPAWKIAEIVNWWAQRGQPW